MWAKAMSAMLGFSLVHEMPMSIFRGARGSLAPLLTTCVTFGRLLYTLNFYFPQLQKANI